MKKITLKEAKNIYEPWRRQSGITNTILSMKEGDIIFIKKDEWKNKNDVVSIVSQYRNMKKNRMYGTPCWARRAEGGWIVGKGIKPEEII